MFVAYTNCETGCRHFTDIGGVDFCFDKRLIDIIVRDRASNTKAMREQFDEMSKSVKEVKENNTLPAFVDSALESHRMKVIDEIAYTRRLCTAEAVLNGTLVRDVLFFPKREQAIAYSKGVS